MKKALLLGLAALFVLAVFSCDSFGIPKTANNIVGYTDDGRAIVELDLNPAGGARALHATLAQAGTDFYEVLFYDGTSYFRISWKEGRTARVRLPLGDYGAAPNFGYIFAGRAEDMMLLGVGLVTAIDGSGTATEVDTDSTKIEFTVTALATDVNNTASSTFQTAPMRVETIKVGERDIPVFMLPANATTSATINITGPSPLLFSQIIRQGNPTFPTKSYIWEEEFPLDLDDVTYTGLGAIGSAVTLPIAIDIDTFADINPIGIGGFGGLSQLSFEFPVYLSNNAASVTGEAAKTWYLKGGLNNALIDTGSAYMGLGGAVLIGSGNVLGGNGLEIIVNP